MPEHNRYRRPTLIALVLASGALLGCERDETTRSAVHLAGQQFAATAAGDPSAFGDQTRETYEEIIRAMQPLAGDADGFAEASAVTLAQARLGLATQAALEAARAETNGMQRARVIRGALSEYLTLAAIAEAASRFDPDADMSDLDRLIDARRADARVYERQKSEMEAQIAELEERIAGLRSRAQEERAKAGTLSLQMAGVSATRAAELAAEVREHTLRADNHELEAIRIEGRVGQLRPTAAEIALNSQKARSQTDQLVQSQRELQARARAAQQDAAEARAAAAETRTRIANLARELAEHRDQTVGPIFDRVHSTLSQSQSALRDARTVTQSSAAVTRAMIHETAGSTWARRAAGHREAAKLYESLHDAGIPGQHQQNARSERQAAEEASRQANEAYRSAAEALRATRARGEAADRIRDAAARLDRLAGIEPEPVPEDQDAWADPDDLGAMDELEALSPEAMSEMTMGEFAAMLPEPVRDMIMQQFEAQMEMLTSIDDPDLLRMMLDELDQQAQMLPAEYAPAFDFVRRRVQDRIDEIESGG
ncbi:MAG: hypothetical protein LAT64_02075 [Phycisphaerales bacterium]|nr:hypothetical protein [Planctomycetota bacterium]MCH8507545.1 hypothetical protein [Phycisphaerales bacterium]